MKGNVTLTEIFYATAISFAGVLAATFFVGGPNMLNDGDHFFAKVLFTNISFMGDGIFAFAIAGLMIFFFNAKEGGIRLLLVLLCCLLIVEIIKNIFSDVPVQIFFESNSSFADETAAISGVISSHAAVAFTLAGFFALHTTGRRTGIIVFIVALGVAVSRNYIAGESLLAILPGIFVAAISLWLMVKISARKVGSFAFRRKRKDRSIADLISWQ